MKVRIKFRKYGIMKFIGHLDVMRYFQKVNRRAGVDIAYSEGFSPHQIMSFASPLGLGLTSDGEYVDMEVLSSESSAEMIRRFQSVMADGFEIVSYKRLPDTAKNAMSIVAAADYLLIPKEERLTGFPDWRSSLQTFLEQETIPVLKKTKKSEKEVDIRPMIYESRLREDGVFVRLASGSAENLKPELMLEAFFKDSGQEWDPFAFRVHRLELYAWDGEEDNRKLLSLDAIGEDIL